MEIVHGAWSMGVNATEAELQDAGAAMAELARIGTHSADVVARWMHAFGMQGVKGDPEECVLVGWLRLATGVSLLSVGRYHVTGHRRSPGCSSPVEVWRIHDPPATHTEVVRRFDDDAWPELIRAN
jgi:hypothetical protein